MRRLLLTLLVLSPLFSASALAPDPLPFCRLHQLSSAVSATLRCFLVELDDVIELEKGERLTGYVFYEKDLFKTSYATFVAETKAILKRKFADLPDAEHVSRGGVRIKISYLAGVDEPYVGAVVAKVVDKGVAPQKTKMKFSYLKQQNHKPTDSEIKDVEAEAAKKLGEFIRWTKKKTASFTPPSAAEIEETTDHWEIRVSAELKHH